MLANEDPQREIALKLVGQDSEATGKRALLLWESLATQLSPIIGELGFSVLYDRTLLRTQTTFPWLAADQTPDATSMVRFAGLARSLAGQPVAESQLASEALLKTFTASLATLIGGPLTSDLLRAVLNDDASEIASRNIDHE
jgi:hypothetical protein